MGAVNYCASNYITMVVKPVSAWDLENDADFMAEYDGTMQDAIDSYISDCYEDDLANVRSILSRFSFWYYHVVIMPGYYEGFSLDIQNNFPCAYDNYTHRREAQKEITQLKKCLLELAGVGLVACYPGWRPAYEDYSGTCKAIKSAIKLMRDEVRTIPTWQQRQQKGI